MTINGGDAPLVLHCRTDGVIPLTVSEELVKNNGLLASVLNKVSNDHWLDDSDPLAAMLGAWESAEGLQCRWCSINCNGRHK